MVVGHLEQAGGSMPHHFLQVLREVLLGYQSIKNKHQFSSFLMLLPHVSR